MRPEHESPVSSTVSEAYRQVRRMGDGARGVVYEVRELHHRRRCALKVLEGEDAQSPERLARFQLQAEIASRLVHPHLVRVLDFGTGTEGQPFLVTELLEGENLAERLARVKRLDPPVVTHILKQIADGLRALHEHGLLHLALKPSNVFLAARVHAGEPDHVKLLDFGTAQVENARTLAGIPSPGDTLAYVSPEQASGGHVRAAEIDAEDVAPPVDQRSDQWALACLAWRMLTGRAPFEADDATSLLYEITYEEPVLAADVGASLPGGLIEIVRKALSKRREDRFVDVDDFVNAFASIAGTLPVFQPPHAPVAPPAWSVALPRPQADEVFLPGLSRRDAEGRESSAASRRRRQRGLRVGVRAQPGAPEPDAPIAATASPFPIAAPAPVSPLSAFAEVDASARKQRWLIAGGVVAAALVGLIVLVTNHRAPPAVSVDRAASSARAPAPPAPTGPVIEPLAHTPAPVAPKEDAPTKRAHGKRASRGGKKHARR